MLELWFHLLFLWLAVLLPFMTWRRRNAYRRGAPGQVLTSRQLYLRVMIGQWLAAGALVFVFWRIGIPLATLGLKLPLLAPTAWIALATLVLLPFALAYNRRVLADPARMAKLRARFGGFSLLVPTNDSEQRWWIALSITAGVCEELLYRGALLRALLRKTTPGWAVFISAAVFGVVHFSDPSIGRTFIAVVAVFWGVYVATGSLLPGMILHAAIDVRGGTFLRRAFTETAPVAA
jgi:membrane protease YdiL (CAAX protease family)